jgi:hypothetical protein
MNAKKIITWILILFAVYLVVVHPTTAADWVHVAFNKVAAGGHSVMRFFDALAT